MRLSDKGSGSMVSFSTAKRIHRGRCLSDKQMVYAVCTSVYGSFRAALGRAVVLTTSSSPEQDLVRQHLYLECVFSIVPLDYVTYQV